MDVTTGSLWEEKTDIALPGPFGLKFTRFYGNQTNYTGDLGTHWSHNFGDRLTTVPVPNPGGSAYGSLAAPTMTLYTDTQRLPHYFNGFPAPGQSIYDSVSGTTVSQGNNGTFTLTTFSGEVRTFDAIGNLIQITDRAGNSQTVTRDPSTEIIDYVTDALGRKLCFYDDANARISVVGAWFSTTACPSSASQTSPQVAFTYDAGTGPGGNSDCNSGDLCSATEPDGKAWTMGYDGNDNLTAIYDPLGDPEELNTFSGQTLVAQQRGSAGAVGGKLQFSYPQPAPTGAGQPSGHTQITNPDTGETSDFYFDQNGDLTTVSGKMCECHGYQQASPDLARAGQLASIADPLGHQTTFASVTGSTSYSPFGESLSMVDANGVATTFTYDGWGRPLASTLLGVSSDPGSLVDQNFYDNAGRFIRHVLPAGNSVAYGYDSSDRLTSVTLADSSGMQHDQLTIGFNSSDELVSRSAQSCALPAVSCTSWSTTTAIGYLYDTFGELVTIEDAALAGNTAGCGAAKTITYTNQGLAATASDENHSTSSAICFNGNLPSVSAYPFLGVSDYGWTYDLAGRATSSLRFLTAATTNPETNYITTSYTHDAADNVSSVTDPNGNLTSYHYDDFGNLLSETSSASGVTTYQYDADDNLVSSLDANGAATTYTYDALDRPTRSASTKSGAPTETVTWSYDDPTAGNFGIGRLSAMIDPTGTATYTYERRGLVTSESRALIAGDSSMHTLTESYAYDANGNLAAMAYPEGLTLAYTYDWADRPYSLAQVGSGTLAPNARSRSPGGAPTLGLSPRVLRSRVSQVRSALPLQREPSAAQPSAVKTPSSGSLPRELPIASRPGPFSGALRRVPGMTHPPERLDAQAQRALAMLLRVGKLSARIPRLAPPRSLVYAPHFPGASYGRAQLTLAGGSGTSIVEGTAYAPFGPMIARQFGNGTTQTVALDARYRVAQNQLTNASGTLLANLKYSEDPNGNITGIGDILNPLYGRAFAYDDLNRLVASITGPAANAVASGATAFPTPSPAPTLGAGLWGTAVYQYDPMGNMTAEQVGARVATFKYSGTTARLTSVNATSTTTGTVTYDAAGNETAVGATSTTANTYTYSARGAASGARAVLYFTRRGRVPAGVGQLSASSPRYPGTGGDRACAVPLDLFVRRLRASLSDDVDGDRADRGEQWVRWDQSHAQSHALLASWPKRDARNRVEHQQRRNSTVRLPVDGRHARRADRRERYALHLRRPPRCADDPNRRERRDQLPGRLRTVWQGLRLARDEQPAPAAAASRSSRRAVRRWRKRGHRSLLQQRPLVSPRMGTIRGK